MAESYSRFTYQSLEIPNKFIKGEFYVIFIDVVSFTKFGDNEALRKVVRELNNAMVDVFGNLEWDVGGSVTKNAAMMMPTGDGYGVGLEPNLVEDRQVLGYASGMSTRMVEAGASVRIGVNKGPCYVHKDINTRMNLTGWGIIDAARAMSCGGKNHILCTRAFAEPLGQDKTEPGLHSVGAYRAKGRDLDLFNYYGDGFGNPKDPER